MRWLCLIVWLCFIGAGDGLRASSEAERLVAKWQANEQAALRLERVFDAESVGGGVRVVDVLYSFDARFASALRTSVVSVVNSPSTGALFRFFFLVERSGSGAAVAAVEDLLRRSGVAAAALRRHVRQWDADALPQRWDCSAAEPGEALAAAGFNVLLYDATAAQRATLALLARLPGGEASLLTMSNLVRNWAHDFLLPFGVRQALYLDADTVVAANLTQLFDVPLSERELVAAARRPESNSASHFNYSHPVVRAAGVTARTRFNAGVILFNLPAYCRADITARYDTLLRWQIDKRQLWLPGRSTHQTPLILAIGNRRRLLPSTWNMCFAGAKIIHCPSTFRAAVLA